MKLKIILLIIVIPFFVAFADDSIQAPAADSTGGKPNPTIGAESHPIRINTSLSRVSEGGSGSKLSRVDREKTTFLICAGRYGVRADAERSVEALTKQGYSPKLTYDGQKEYRVVMKKAKGISQAEKIKAQFQKSGITCFIEEE